MRGREPDEPHRAATPLELFFDLVIVVAVAVAAASLHHGIAEDHVPESILRYVMTFGAIWWAWMSFTWFATGYDNDDVPYRISVFVQMAGAIIIAAGIGRAFDDADWSMVLLGYIVMRAALVALWLRAARGDPSHRQQNIRWAVGTAAMQVAWIVAFLLVPADLFMQAFAILFVGELLVPVIATRDQPARWHSEHIAERYGLLTIIVLGESILAGVTAFSSVASDSFTDLQLLFLAVGALMLVFTMWWLYFERPSDDLLTSRSRAFEWGYGHFFIWAAAAAVGGGIAVGVDVLTDHAEVDLTVAGAAVAVPVAVYLLGVWVLHDVPRPMSRLRMALSPVAAVLVLLTPLTPQPILVTGVVVGGLLVAKLGTAQHEIPPLPTFSSGGELVDVSDRDALYDVFDEE
jgi:low temperature requirement protein LtrA